MNKIKSRMQNGSAGLEFLRFGSSIPGNYWGCCAADIIQNFKVDPDAKASIEILGGDSGQSVGDAYAGPTYRDIFHQRLRIGTFGTSDMPNHAFFAIITEWQVQSAQGKKWLRILADAGFEFVRTVNNSVYSGPTLASAPSATVNNNDNHIFMLVRNIGNNALKDQFTPPKEWASIKGRKPTFLDIDPKLQKSGVDLTKSQFDFDRAVWDKIGKANLLTKKQVEEAGAPVMLAGRRSEFPGEPAATRDSYLAQQETADRQHVDAILRAAGVTPTDAQRQAAYTAAGIAVKQVSLKAAPKVA